MSIIRKLERSYYLLWATPAGEQVPFEVSKEVTRPLQPLCETSPYCPDERIPRIQGESVESAKSPPKIASVVQYVPNPNFDGVKDCPYDFRNKEDCYRDINISAFKQALFTEHERTQITNYLTALGYSIGAERIGASDIDGARILKAHGVIYNFHETRFEIGPGHLSLCMIRNPYETSSETAEDEEKSPCRS